MFNELSKKMQDNLRKFGIDEPWQLLFSLPKNYDDFTKPALLSDCLKLDVGDGFYIQAMVSGVRTNAEVEQDKRSKGQDVKVAARPYLKIDVTDGVTTKSPLHFGFQEPWLNVKKHQLGKIIQLSGRIGSYKGENTLENLNLVPYEEQGKINPRYRGKKGLIAEGTIAELTKIALLHSVDDAAKKICETLGEDEAKVLRSCGIKFNSLKHLITTLHMPRTSEDLSKALNGARRLNAYLGIRQAMESTIRKPVPSAAVPIDKELIKSLVDRHPFTPTGDQRRAIWEMIKGMSQNVPMDMLLSADVGNGKTMAFGIGAAYMASQGKNVVILLPNAALANQVYDEISSWYPELKMHLVQKGFKGTVEEGSILVGTSAVNSWLKKNPEWRVHMAITDEQQKMGVLQRQEISKEYTHILEATATPIPRTMAQTLFGNKSVCFIEDSPVKKEIATHLMGNTFPERRKVMDLLEKALADGNKIAVIYPLVAEKQAHYYHIAAQSLKEAEKIAAMLKKTGTSIKDVTGVADAPDLLKRLDADRDTGFVVEVHAEDIAQERIQQRFDEYLKENASLVTYLGSLVDEALVQKNRATIEAGARMWEAKHPGRVKVLHGRADEDEKTRVIREMNAGNGDILVATTLVEIGVTIDKLVCLVVVDAENLGAYTLHQLRGRLVRKGGKGDFYMLAGSKLEDLSDTARDRLRLLIKYTKGSDIAMHDMDQRGFGSFKEGGKQNGFTDGLFPGLKLSASELENFLQEVSAEIKARNNNTSLSL